MVYSEEGDEGYVDCAARNDAKAQVAAEWDVPYINVRTYRCFLRNMTPLDFEGYDCVTPCREDHPSARPGFRFEV